MADETKAHDPVNHPPHYTSGSIECIDAIRAAIGDAAFLAFCRAQVIRYAWRAGLKDDYSEDLRKAAWYAERGAQTNEELAGGEDPCP